MIRASSIYLMLVLLLRFLPNRTTGSLGPADLPVVMVATIVAWSFITDILANEHDGRMSVIRGDGARPEARVGRAGIRR